MSNNKKPTVTVYRSSVSGEFVKPGYAQKHPKVTEKEKYKK